MSLGLVVPRSDTTRRRQDGQYIADLASLFERRRIALGDVHVCEQFEILFTTSEAFRGQLFTLCTAISHMSEEDLSGEELLSLVARALRAPSDEMPESLRTRFLAGMDAWNNRGMAAIDEWPPRKKPSAPETVLPPEPWPALVSSMPEPLAMPEPSAEPALVRPAGVRTLQEALELAKLRGGDRPLRPEPVVAEAAPIAAQDTNSATLEELNTLLAQIEERMKRLRPQLVETGAQPLSVVQPLEKQSASSPVPVEETAGLRPLSPEEREAAFLARHPYLRQDRVRPVWDAAEYAAEPVLQRPSKQAEPKQSEPQQIEPQEIAVAAPVVREPVAELLLVPRKSAPLDERAPMEKPARLAEIVPVPPPGSSERQRLKTYLALAVLAGIALVATPVTGVLAYRYMHPMYIYQPAATPTPAPQPESQAPTAQPAAKAAAKPVRKSRAAHPAAHRPAVSVWPPDPNR